MRRVCVADIFGALLSSIQPPARSLSPFTSNAAAELSGGRYVWPSFVMFLLPLRTNAPEESPLLISHSSFPSQWICRVIGGEIAAGAEEKTMSMRYGRFTL